MWPVVNPGVKLIWGRHLDAICEHLEAVTWGQLRTVLINIPPGTSKTTLVQQMWPTWEWLHSPAKRWFFVTNSLANASKEATFRRQLVTSDEYRALRPGFELAKAGKRVMLLRNSENGSFRALSTGSRVTGDHGDRLVTDDIHDAASVAQVELAADCAWADGALSTRTRDGHAQVDVLQRLAEGDYAAHRLRQGVDAHICLPALYDAATDPGPTPLGWSDWRTRAGENLYPERLTAEWLADRRTKLGKVGFAAQVLQSPIAGEGNLFDRGWWLRHDQEPREVAQWLGAVDTAAATHDDADRTCLQVWALGRDGVAYLCECVSGRWEMPETLRQLGALAQRWPLCRRWLVERRGNGFALIDLARVDLPRLSIIPWKSQEPKESRISGVSPHVEGARVSVCRGGEGDALIEEAARFPRATHDDRIDTAAIILREWTSSLMARPSPPPQPRPMPSRTSPARPGWRSGSF